MIKGYLRLVDQHSTNAECSSEYVFIEDTGVIHRYLKNESNAPINIRIGIELDGSTIISWDYLSDTVLGYKDETVKDIALVRVVSEGHLNQDDFDKVIKQANDLEDFLKKVNEGNQFWTHVSVTPYAVENLEMSGYGPSSFQFTNPTLLDRLREQHPDKVDNHNYWHGWGGSHPQYLGLAFRDGDRAWTFASGQRTMRHEQGHNLGCPHSSTENDEYGDPTCVMARAHGGFNASHMGRMKQIDDRHQAFEQADVSDTFYICPVEVSTQNVREGEYRGVYLQTANNTRIGLSARKPHNQSYLGSRKDGDLHIHKVVGNFSTPFGGSPVYLDRLQKGESKEFEGVQIKNVDDREGVIKVEVNGGSSESSDFPSTLPVIAGDPFTDEQSMVWFNHNYKHQGVDMFVIPDEDRLIGYWFTHHPKGAQINPDTYREVSSRQWFVIDGKINSDNTVDCTIYSTYGREKQVEGWGKMRLDGESLFFRFYTKSYGRDSFTLHPLTAPKDSEVSGLYETGDYEGFSVGKYGNVYVAYHFTYGWQSDKTFDWEVYQGDNPDSLPGYKVEGRYRVTYEKDPEEIEPLNLTDMMNTATRIL